MSSSYGFEYNGRLEDDSNLLVGVIPINYEDVKNLFTTRLLILLNNFRVRLKIDIFFSIKARPIRTRSTGRVFVDEPVKDDSELMEILKILGIVVVCLSLLIFLVLLAKRAWTKSSRKVRPEQHEKKLADDKEEEKIELNESLMKTVKDGSVIYQDIFV
jgi:hypothetical protein